MFEFKFFIVYICKMNAANRILEIIEISGLTASEFAEKINVQPSAISHLTSGRNKPSLEFLIKIKHAFPSIDTDWLFLGKRKIDEKDSPTILHEAEKNENTGNINRSNTNKVPVRVLLFFDDGTFENYNL